MVGFDYEAALGKPTKLVNDASLAVQFAHRLRRRRMRLLYVTVLVVSAVIAAAAPTHGLFGPG